MKNSGTVILITITLVFVAFICGMLVGRQLDSTPVSVALPTTETGTFETASSTTDSGSKLNINTASLDSLDELPGIGPVLAQRIVEFREENGPFSSIYDLSKVEGIGTNKLMDILELITVGG